jgi:transcriptional regulator with XRE-family HTH domain
MRRAEVNGRARRRTPGLRREEVAQRASISPTWCTWLGQGRGGAPSAEVLERIASALMLTELEREHLFLIGPGRPPEARYRSGGGVTPRLQRVLQALEPAPAPIRTATCDVVAWNRTAPVMLVDYGQLAPHERNILRFMFLDPRARAGAAAEVEPLVEELRRASPEFEAMWRDHDLRSHGEAIKHIRRPVLGPLAFEYSAFAVDGRPDLSLVVYNPVEVADLERIAGVEGEAEA